MNRTIALLLSFSPLVLAACASAAEPAATPANDALATLRAGGNFGFVLDESDPASKFRADCAAKHPGDAAGAGACYDAIRQQGAREGIRFSLDASGRIVWTSYGVEDGKPATYIEAHLDATPESPGVVAVRLSEPARGLQVEGRPFPPNAVMRFQVVDANTVLMFDGQKGKLVFRRLPVGG
jgi:hypothetical protein